MEISYTNSKPDFKERRKRGFYTAMLDEFMNVSESALKISCHSENEFLRMKNGTRYAAERYKDHSFIVHSDAEKWIVWVVK